MAQDFRSLLFPSGSGWLKWENPITYSISESGLDYSVLPYPIPGTGFPPTFIFPFSDVSLNPAQIAAVDWAVHVWSEVANVNLTQAPLGQSGDIRIGAYNFSNGFGGASTTALDDITSIPDRGDIWFNNSYSISGQTPIPTPQIGDAGWYAFIHEMGHALGLNHPGGDPYDPTYNMQFTVMSYNTPGGAGTFPDPVQYPITPMVLDIQAVQELYGANFSTRNADTTYLFTGINEPIWTIWDGGGIDTIDASLLSSPVTINLTPGAYSSIGGTNNVGIAFLYQGDVRSYIENAVGGLGDDVITGNAVANRLIGNGGNDQLSGGDGNDILIGGAGQDTLNGGPGHDTADYLHEGGPNGIKVIYSAPGTATVTDTFGDTDTLISVEEIYGTNKDDVLTGSAGSETFIPGRGNDTISSGGGLDSISYLADNAATSGVTINLALGLVTSAYYGTDTLIDYFRNVYGTQNNDTLIASNAGFQRLLPSLGTDTVQGGSGFDILRYDDYRTTNSGHGVTFNVGSVAGSGTVIDAGGSTDTYTGIEYLSGSWNDDTFNGGAFRTNFQGIGGNNTYHGGTAGNDRVDYSFDDTFGATHGVSINLSSGTGTNSFGGTDTFINIQSSYGTIFGDTFIGSNADDQFFGLRGADTIIGGPGNDAADYSLDEQYGGLHGINVNLKVGQATDGFGTTDTLSSIEYVTGTRFSDTIVGDDGPNLLRGLAGSDTLDGGLGIDLVDYDWDRFFGGISGVNVNLGLNKAVDGFGSTDSLTGIENVTGTIYADTIIGNSVSNTLSGGDGNDILNGGAGNDTLNGGAGDDILIGGLGDDTYIFFHGADNVFGSDTIIENPGEGIDSVYTATLSYTIEANVENVFFIGTGNFTGVGNVLANVLSGGAGVDTLAGRDGDDTLIGGPGADILDGGNGSDRASYSTASAGVTANLSKPSLNTGDAAGDSYVAIEGLEGSNFSDTLIGNNSINTLIGGMGNDTLTGLNGADTFAFSSAIFGKDVITDFAATGNNHDILQFDHSIFASGADALNHAAQVGKNVVITFDAADTVTLIGVNLHQLSTSDFHIL